jgi:hypothetical protein
MDLQELSQILNEILEQLVLLEQLEPLDLKDLKVTLEPLDLKENQVHH